MFTKSPVLRTKFFVPVVIVTPLFIVVPPEGTVQFALKVADEEYVELQSAALTFEL